MWKVIATITIIIVNTSLAKNGTCHFIQLIFGHFLSHLRQMLDKKSGTLLKQS